MITNRQYTCAKYHFQSAQHYAETQDWEKMLAHSHAAELIITTGVEDYRDYIKWCTSNKITKYDWTREVRERKG